MRSISDSGSMRLEIVAGMGAIDRAAWNRLAQPEDKPYDPFLDWDFLEALERSGSVAPETGWIPNHLALFGSDGELAGAMPLYLKLHSQGEFVFDHEWADAFAHAGGQYYPKLLSAVPFTPVTGRRLLVSSGPDADRNRDLLVEAATVLAARNGISSCHVNFVESDCQHRLAERGFLLREGQQFHWKNKGYGDFEAFLSRLASRKRKAVRRERQGVRDAGIGFERVAGADLRDKHWQVFFDCYQDTGARKWGVPYLNREFFELLHERMAECVLLVMACAEGRYIASALNLIGSETLYGRYWGCVRPVPFLHFEACYYQAIDFAIEQGLDRVEAGAQGQHKLARGYEPTITHSAHWIGHRGLRDAVAKWLRTETRLVRTHNDALRAHRPFAQCGDDAGEGETGA